MFPCTFAFAFAGLGELVALVFALAFVLFALFVRVHANAKMVQANRVITLRLRFIHVPSRSISDGGAGATIVSRSFVANSEGRSGGINQGNLNHDPRERDSINTFLVPSIKISSSRALQLALAHASFRCGHLHNSLGM